MSFLKYGSAVLTEPGISINRWSDLISQAGLSKARVKMASERISSEFPTSDFLLSHATIIASVDVEKAARSASKFDKFLITPESTKYVNKNMDCWTSGVLENSYHTFRFVPNYVEHVQIPALSKGRIIDSVLRKVDDTTLVDILVATQKTHSDIIRKIENGYFGGMSMGSIVKFTICSQCGKIIHDDSEKCMHIRYSLGDKFIDNNGIERIIAEICGHESCPDSNIFIEASWVKDPAFVGAVVSRVLNPTQQQLQKLQAAFTESNVHILGSETYLDNISEIEDLGNILEFDSGMRKAASVKHRFADEAADAEMDDMLDESPEDVVEPDTDIDEELVDEEVVEETTTEDDPISENISNKVTDIVEDIVDSVLDKIKGELIEEDPLKSDLFDGSITMLEDSIIQSSANNERKFVITYEIWDEDALDSGETDNRGFIDEEGVSMQADDMDREHGITSVDNAVDFLESNMGNQGLEASSTGKLTTNDWWTSYEYNLDLRTGEVENRSFHPYGFTAEELNEINRRVK